MATEFIPQSTVIPQLTPQTQPIDLTNKPLLSKTSTPTCGFGAECPFLKRQGALQSHLSDNQHAPIEKRLAETSHTMSPTEEGAKIVKTKRSRTTPPGHRRKSNNYPLENGTKHETPTNNISPTANNSSTPQHTQTDTDSSTPYIPLAAITLPPESYQVIQPTLLEAQILSPPFPQLRRLLETGPASESSGHRHAISSTTGTAIKIVMHPDPICNPTCPRWNPFVPIADNNTASIDQPTKRRAKKQATPRKRTQSATTSSRKSDKTPQSRRKRLHKSTSTSDLPQNGTTPTRNSPYSVPYYYGDLRATHPVISNNVLHSASFVSVFSCHLFFYAFTFYVLITFLAPTSDSLLYVRTYVIACTTLVAWVVLYVLAILLMMQESGVFTSSQIPMPRGTFIQTKSSIRTEEAYV